MSPVTIAFVAENFVLLAVIGAGWHLLRQGGGLQVKTPPVSKSAPRVQQEAASENPLRAAS